MTKTDLQAWRAMLVKVRDARRGARGQEEDARRGSSAAKPAAEFGARYGKGMIKADMLIEAIW